MMLCPKLLPAICEFLGKFKGGRLDVGAYGIIHGMCVYEYIWTDNRAALPCRVLTGVVRTHAVCRLLGLAIRDRVCGCTMHGSLTCTCVRVCMSVTLHMHRIKQGVHR